MATAEMNAGAPPIARDTNKGWTPPVPESVEATGLSEEAVADLLLKVLYVQGARSGDSLTRTVALPFDIVDNVLHDLQQRRFIEVRKTEGHGRGGYTFDITGAGRERAREALEGNQYVGPAPVPLDQYRAATLRQSVGEVHITRSRIREGFDDLVLDEHLFEALGPAVNSAKSLFLYGAPGNGKTHMAEIIARLMGSASIWIPYALDVDGQMVVLFDPVHHQRIKKEADEGDGGAADVLIRKDTPYDRRYVQVRRPIVMTGGELTMNQLDLEYDRHTKMYQAPFQVKANGGVLIIDDFGRQRVPPHELLNRWIVPLEKRRDYLTLHTGVKFPVPFDTLIIFATNLDPSDLVDEAFMRRIHYKIEVPSPNREQYEVIFERACDSRNIPYDPRAVEYIYRKYYGTIGIEPRGCHPRDITDHVLDYARYVEAEPKLTPELIDSACDSYFRVMAADDMRQAGAR